MSRLELHWHISDEMRCRLLNDLHVDDADIEKVNAVCEAWGDEETNGQTLAEMRGDLERRILAVFE
jgi:hypothetical protein